MILKINKLQSACMHFIQEITIQFDNKNRYKNKSENKKTWEDRHFSHYFSNIPSFYQSTRINKQTTPTKPTQAPSTRWDERDQVGGSPATDATSNGAYQCQLVCTLATTCQSSSLGPTRLLERWNWSGMTYYACFDLTLKTKMKI